MKTLANNIVSSCDKMTLEESQTNDAGGKKNFFATKSRFSTHNQVKLKKLNRHIASTAYGGETTMDASKMNGSVTDTFDMGESTLQPLNLGSTATDFNMTQPLGWNSHNRTRCRAFLVSEPKKLQDPSK
jgi:hypothetical protein